MMKNLHLLSKALKAVILIAGFASITAYGQLSGTYTLNSGAATGGTNYQTWADFATAINTNGVSAPVTLNVVTSDFNAAEITFNNIAGASATNTVTIKGANNTVSFASTATNTSVFNFNGNDYFTIDSLTISNTSLLTSARCIWIHNSSNNNTFKNCTFQYTNLVTGATAGGAHIVGSGSATSMTTVDNVGNNNVITNNTFKTTAATSQGSSAAIWLYSSSTTSSTGTVSNWDITNNKIENFFMYGIYVYNHNGTNVENNDITRKNTSGNANSTMYGIYYYYCKSTTRAWKVNNNNIHDLPGAGSNPSLIYGVYSYFSNYYGSITGKSEVNNNTINNLKSTSQVFPMYCYYTSSSNFNNNSITNIDQSNSTAYYYGMYLYFCGGYNATMEVNNNNITGPVATEGGYYYMLYLYYPQNTGTLTVEKNLIHDAVCGTSGSGYYTYGLYCYYGNSTKSIIRENKLYNLKRPNYGYVYGMYVYQQRDAKIMSNLMYDFAGYYGLYAMYAYSGSTGYKMTINQNTFDLDGSTSSYQYASVFGLYAYSYYDLTRAHGNIVSIKNCYSAYPLYNYSTLSTATNDYNWNNYYTTNCQYVYCYYKGTFYSDLAAYVASGEGGPQERSGNPQFVNAPTNYATTLFLHQNVVPTDADEPKDVLGVARNTNKSDVGAVEGYLDLQVSTSSTLPATICSGTEQTISVTVKNTFPYAGSGVPVKYTATGGNSSTGTITNTIASGASETFTFPVKVKFNAAGAQTLTIGLGLVDDNPSNDQVVLSTVVSPAPGGSKFVASSKTTETIYNTSKPDVTQINTHSYYNLAAPRSMTNGAYGTAWTASSWVNDASGNAIPASHHTLTAPGANDMELDLYVTDAAYEDQTLTMFVKFTNLVSGCDTTIAKQILIYPNITPNFSFPTKICDGDAVLFENKSLAKSGGMEFIWDFGTGNAADNTEAPEPVFAFPTKGSYTVKLIAKTLPYGFAEEITKTVNVNEIPKANFTKLNACQGVALTFSSTTTPSASVLSWDFGDASIAGNLANTSHTYAATGNYKVVLSANLNGCIAKATQVAYQFEKPKALAAVLSGSCDNEEIIIKNNSTIASGNFGTIWDLDDNGALSTQKDAKHTFSSPGTKNVKLKVASDFGCKDEITIPVTVKEAPKVAFSNTQACSIDPTDFTNLTPAVSGTNPTYSWIFSDGGTSSVENPTHSWVSLGAQKATLKVTLNNGCSGTVSKDLVVGNQPSANFQAVDVCAGDAMLFDNQTTWPSGDVSYTWDFADGNTSTDSDPSHVFTNSATKTYVVTLTAKIAGGCEDITTKQVTVNEKPQTCDFTAAKEYVNGLTNMKFTPTGGSMSGIAYSWVFDEEGSGNSTATGIQHLFQRTGDYTVTMRAKVASTGCECTATKTITVNSVAGANSLQATVYPNPSATGLIQVKMDAAQGKDVQFSLVSMSGAVVKTTSATNTGVMTINVSDISSGVYMLRMVSGEEVTAIKVTIQN